MDKKLSLQDYDTLYRTALLAREQVHVTVPKTIESLDEYQQICRICGCHDDGHLVDLDKNQDFDFEPSICNYRMLFQRTSLQFQFHTMPDLPASICATCAYKVKIFFLLTRQFVIGQQAMRTVVTDFYRDNYGIEPPEQLEDRLQLHKQLALLAKLKQRPSRGAANKELIKVCAPKRVNAKLQRSTSADSSLNAGVKKTTARGQVQASAATNRRKNLVACQLSQSTMNLRQRPNKSPCPKKKPPTKQPATAAPRVQRKERNPLIGKATATATATATTATTTATTTMATARVQCAVTPRVEKPSGKDEALPAKNQTALANNTQAVAASVESPTQQKQTMPPSKAQLQKKLQDRRKQWR